MPRTIATRSFAGRPRRLFRRPRQRGGTPRPRRLLLAAVAAAVATTLLPAPVIAVHLPAVDRPAPRDGLDWLSVQGRDRIVDQHGRVVQLRGFNTEALLDYPWGSPAPIDERDAARIAAAGFDVIRLPIAWSRLEPTRGRFDTAYLDLIDATVQAFNRHHLRVVLDMHFLDWGPQFGGSGAPDWAAVPGVPDWGFGLHDPFNKHASPATWEAFTYFFLSDDWQHEFQAAWRQVAGRFRDRSGVVGYDLFNEPHPLPIPPRLYEDHVLFPLYARTMEAIAATDPNHLYLLEGILFADWGTEIPRFDAPNIVYSPHTYSGSLVPPPFDGDPGQLRGKVGRQAAEATRLGAPFWDGEIGIDWHQHLAPGWADAALDSLDAVGAAGWAWWQWRQDDHWGIEDRDGTLHPEHLAHLARPYLQAAPAGVRAGHGDGVRGTLTIEAASNHAAGVVLVGWSSLTLRAPRVSGGCAASQRYDASAGTLTLDLVTGSGCSLRVEQAATSSG